jgi:predicted ATPase
MESIRIQSFAGLKDVTIELKPINVFVGPQAAGKSVAAKLIYSSIR